MKIGDPTPLLVPQNRILPYNDFEEDWFNDSFNGNQDMFGEFIDNGVEVGDINTSSLSVADNKFDGFRDKLTGLKIDELSLLENDINLFAIDKYVITRAQKNGI